jgi:tetratricopeptide (TPR) repeat protein
MESGKRQHLQDIYSTERSVRDDFTPQVSSEAIEEHKRGIRRQQLTSFFLGLLVLVLSVSLVWIVVREYIEITSLPPSPTPITQEYIPRHSLSSESQWVLDFSASYAEPTWDGEGERPLSSDWVRKTAYNIIMAEQAADLGEFEKAATYYENALEIFPGIEGVKVPLGTLYFRLEAYDKALALMKDAPEADMTPDVLNNLGAACIHADAYEDAELYLKQAISLKPTYAEAQKNLALLYKDQERSEDAVGAFEKYIDLRPDDVDMQHNFALYLTKLGRWTEAAVLLDDLTQKITDVPVLFFLLAQVESHNNRPDKVMAALKRGIQLSDPNSALGYMDMDEFEQLRESDDFQFMINALKQSQESK